METVIPIVLFKLLKPGDWKAFLVTHRIPFARKDDAYCRILLKLQIHFIQCAVNTCLHNFKNVIFHPRKDYLCLRVTEPCVVLQHLRPFLREHKPEEDDSLKGPSLCLHSVHGSLIDVFIAEFFHFLCVKRAR